MFWTRTPTIVGGPLLIFGLLAAGLQYDLFDRIVYYDLFMHALGGIVVAASTAGLLWRILKVRGVMPKSVGCLVFVPLTVVLLVSLLWEAAEVLFGMTPNWTQSAKDTLSDVIHALGGAGLMLYIIRLQLRSVHHP